VPRQAGSRRLSPTLDLTSSEYKMPNTRGALALRCWATAARAARPASLASSARTEALEAGRWQASARGVQPKTIGARVSIHVGSGAGTCWVRSFHSPREEDTVRVGSAGGFKNSMFCKAWSFGSKTPALRRSAKPNARGRAATSYARGGSFCLLAGGATQRTMHAGQVHYGARSNPSIERTCPGKPGHASHLKR
jgi:hypothetical protein